MTEGWSIIGVDQFRLDGRVALVTGASSGLGVAFARSLAAAGARVVVAARRRDRLDSLVGEIEERGGEALAVTCDVTREAEVDAAVASAVERFGALDVLVANAGVTEPVPAEAETLETFRRVVDVNLTGVFLCAQRGARVMLERGRGSIVPVASVLGLVGAGQIPQASYAASKGAVVNLTRELAAQWARRGLRVNSIAPGWFPSEMTGEMFDSERGRSWIRRRTPMGRAGELAEITGALLFLASDASSYVTGQTIAVDGGWTIV
jgi:NAD(P)-dependent dehydrogenase (short-subunit alcohol dehydrogenase family)